MTETHIHRSLTYFTGFPYSSAAQQLNITNALSFLLHRSSTIHIRIPLLRISFRQSTILFLVAAKTKRQPKCVCCMCSLFVLISFYLSSCSVDELYEVDEVLHMDRQSLHEALRKGVRLQSRCQGHLRSVRPRAQRGSLRVHSALHRRLLEASACMLRQKRRMLKSEHQTKINDNPKRLTL